MLDTNQDIHPSFTQRLDTRTQVHMHPWLLYLLHMLTLRTNSNLTVQKHLLIPREIRITTVLFCAISALCKVWERTVEKQRELRPWWPPPIRPADHKCKRSIARHKTGETSSQLDMSAVKLQWHLINNTKLRQVVLSSFNFITNNNFCFHQRHAYLVSRDNRHIVMSYSWLTLNHQLCSWVFLCLKWKTTRKTWNLYSSQSSANAKTEKAPSGG